MDGSTFEDRMNEWKSIPSTYSTLFSFVYYYLFITLKPLKYNLRYYLRCNKFLNSDNSDSCNVLWSFFEKNKTLRKGEKLKCSLFLLVNFPSAFIQVYILLLTRLSALMSNLYTPWKIIIIATRDISVPVWTIQTCHIFL